MAEEHNPTLAQAQHPIEAARGRKLQVGLYPNPTVGYKGDEIRDGSYGGGEEGFFAQQPIILGGKLWIAKCAGPKRSGPIADVTPCGEPDDSIGAGQSGT